MADAGSFSIRLPTLRFKAGAGIICLLSWMITLAIFYLGNCARPCNLLMRNTTEHESAIVANAVPTEGYAGSRTEEKPAAQGID